MGLSNFYLPEAITQTAKDIDGLFGMIFWISLVAFILVEALLVIFLIRYKRKHPDKQGLAIHGNTKAEVIWTMIPALILVGIGIYSSGMVYTIQEPPTDVYEIKVTGMKWAWEFEYPNGAKTYGELRIPENENVLFKIYSKDVIHSFWIPEFRVKQDAVPGRETRFWVKAETFNNAENKYEKRIICAEYCGNQHSNMLADLQIMPADEFTAWVDKELTRPKTDAQYVIQSNGCTSCHTIDGGKSAGPTWKGLFGKKQIVNGQEVTVDEKYLEEAIMTPDAKTPEGFNSGMMPAFQLEPDAMKNVVEYIKSLK
ncbi:cytochrome c oxidase subunit 2 [Tumebacillus sp. BK434]|uniref:cytochrome c oxidase subunit II n=1 Tax=Tumebacillus sp. BK434 TaxID=2512169 RepID=UPI001042DA5B|nr:cytochrome c oxidase subunit II [Tumebacillus sp. BK434]TCP55725.1 cytochrome c oxidase subunit 2 [Tumebacillus sp. BK434]